MVKRVQILRPTDISVVLFFFFSSLTETSSGNEYNYAVNGRSKKRLNTYVIACCYIFGGLTISANCMSYYSLLSEVSLTHTTCYIYRLLHGW